MEPANKPFVLNTGFGYTATNEWLPVVPAVINSTLDAGLVFVYVNTSGVSDIDIPVDPFNDFK